LDLVVGIDVVGCVEGLLELLEIEVIERCHCML